MNTSASIPKTILRHRLWTYIGLTIFGSGCDLWTKQAIFDALGLPGERPPHWLIENYFGFETAVNQGALFGLGQGLGLVFGAVSICAIVAIVLWLFKFQGARSSWLTCALGLVSGGILGNLYDRLNMHGLPGRNAGGVRDWILFRYGEHTWPNFNIADSLLVVGAIMLGIHSFTFSDSKLADSIAADQKSATP
jgi:signal peptidase II